MLQACPHPFVPTRGGGGDWPDPSHPALYLSASVWIPPKWHFIIKFCPPFGQNIPHGAAIAPLSADIEKQTNKKTRKYGSGTSWAICGHITPLFKIRCYHGHFRSQIMNNTRETLVITVCMIKLQYVCVLVEKYPVFTLITKWCEVRDLVTALWTNHRSGSH